MYAIIESNEAPRDGILHWNNTVCSQKKQKRRREKYEKENYSFSDFGNNDYQSIVGLWGSVRNMDGHLSLGTIWSSVNG